MFEGFKGLQNDVAIQIAFSSGLSSASAAPLVTSIHVFISHAWDYKEDYDGIVNLLNLDRTFLWTDFSVPIEAPLKMTLLLKKSYRTIVRQLDERVALADCMVALSAMYFKHRGWIQSEIEAALEFGKPIIAIAPRGQERSPSELAHIARETVGWTSKSIVTAIRRHVGP